MRYIKARIAYYASSFAAELYRFYFGIKTITKEIDAECAPVVWCDTLLRHIGLCIFGGDRRDYDYSGLTPNYIPFSSIVKSIRGFQIDGDWKNLIEIFGNLVLLPPFSFLLSFKVHPEKIYVLFALLIALVCIETAQQVLIVGVFDVDDIILDFIGAGFGILAQTAAAFL